MVCKISNLCQLIFKQNLKIYLKPYTITLSIVVLRNINEAFVFTNVLWNIWAIELYLNIFAWLLNHFGESISCSSCLRKTFCWLFETNICLFFIWNEMTFLSDQFGIEHNWPLGSSVDECVLGCFKSFKRWSDKKMVDYNGNDIFVSITINFIFCVHTSIFPLV